MKPERARYLELNQEAKLTAKELLEGWRFCACEWDGMLININDKVGEGQFCKCHKEISPLEALEVLCRTEKRNPALLIGSESTFEEQIMDILDKS